MKFISTEVQRRIMFIPLVNLFLPGTIYAGPFCMSYGLIRLQKKDFV